jgi:DNA repair protein RadC
VTVPVSGNPARIKEPTMSHDLSFLNSAFFVMDVAGAYREAHADEVLRAAQNVLLSRINDKDIFESPQAVRDFLRVRLSALEHEVFAVLHLDAQSRLLEYVEMFRGTVSQTSVYPREIVKESLARNSAAVILVHNHPSGAARPSRADEALTQTLKAALSLVDVRVLDHLIVAGADVVSFAEMGLL